MTSKIKKYDKGLPQEKETLINSVSGSSDAESDEIWASDAERRWRKPKRLHKINKCNSLKRNIVIFVITGLVVSGIIIGVTLSIHDVGKDEPRGIKEFKNAVTAADSPDCSEIGRDILYKGGSAADATIAGLLCIGLMNAHSSGIGGGDFFVYYHKETNEVLFLDSREVAPLAAFETMYENDTSASTKGGLAIGVPGEVSGFWELHQRYGKLEWADLFQPAIKMARNGFLVGTPLGRAIEQRKEDILADPNLREIFVKDDGELYKAGDIMYRPKLADTMERIASGGRKAFYSGRLAEDIVQDIQDYSGIITMEDMEGYETTIRPPAHIVYHDWHLYSASAPGSGNVLALMLNILEGYGFTSDSISNTDEAILTFHRIVEAFKFAYAKRSALGDPDFVELTDFLAEMLDEEYAESLRQKITDDTTHTYEYYEPAFLSEEDAGTAHVSIIDAEGNAASTTATINLYLGSKCRGARTGIIFNDEMDDFSQPGAPNFFGLPPSPSNFIRPKKRPMSSMTPTVLVHRDTREADFIVGASGGTRITTATALAIIQTLSFGLSIEDAIERKRLHDQLVPTRVNFEPDFNPAILEGLAAKGHNVTQSSSFAVVQGIRRLADGWFSAHCDSRKGGAPSGY